jgi:hypothetical protein
MGLIVLFASSSVMGQKLIPNQENGNELAEKVVPNVLPTVKSDSPPYGTIFMLQKPIACNDTPLIKNYIQDTNGMIPITMGLSKNPMGGILSLVQVYANPDTEKFAVVEHFAIEKSCILFQGHDFDIILPERYYQQEDGSKRPEQQAYKLR